MSAYNLSTTLEFILINDVSVKEPIAVTGGKLFTNTIYAIKLFKYDLLLDGRATECFRDT